MASPTLHALATIPAASKEAVAEGKPHNLSRMPECGMVTVGVSIDGAKAKVHIMAKMNAQAPWLPACAHRVNSALFQVPFAPYLRADVSDRADGAEVDVRISY